MSNVVFLVPCDSGHCKTFRIRYRRFAVPVDDIVYRPEIVPVEDADIQDVFSEKRLVGNLGDGIFAVFLDDDDFRKVGAVAYVFGVVLLFQGGPHEALGLVDIELGVVVDLSLQ